MPDKTQDFADLAATGLMGAVIAVIFRTVREERDSMHGEFTGARFVMHIISAAAVGVITSWMLAALGVNQKLSAAIIAIAGYVGGPLLDLLYKEVRELAQVAFDAVEKWIAEGKWIDKK